MTGHDSAKRDGKIAIVGCGPAGLVSAIAFARRGIATTLYEQAADPFVAPRYNPDRSYAIDITGHGLKALRYIDACEAFDAHMFPFKGIRFATGFRLEESWDEAGWTGSRGDILRALWGLARERHGELIQAEFQTRVVDLDVHQGVLVLEREGSSWFSEPYDLILGADGGGSTVREALKAQIDGFTTRYKSIPNYATMLELDRVGEGLDPRYLYILSHAPFSVAGAINGEGGIDDRPRWFCVVGTREKLAYADPSQARKHLQRRAPKLLEFASDEAIEAFVARECHHIGRILTCSQLYGGRAALLGDAGAPFSPIGQGINAAMESAMLLDQCFDTHGERQQELLHEYQRRWKPEAEAAAWISEKFEFGRASHLLRLKLTARFGVNVLSNAKRLDLSYTQVRQKAEAQWPLWAW